MRCYYCNGGSSATENSMWFDAFASPTYTDRKVTGLLLLVADGAATSNTFKNVKSSVVTNTKLKTAVVTACSGPTTLKKGIKGQRFTVSITT